MTLFRVALLLAHHAEWQRLEKLLEDTGITLTSVATDISGASDRSAPWPTTTSAP